MAITVSIGDTAQNSDYHFCPGENIYNGSKDFIDNFNSMDSLEEDLLNLASGIYCTDLAVLRNDRERFIRTIDISIEVVNYHLFNQIRDKLRRALFILSSDNWNINFVQKPGTPVTSFNWTDAEGVVLLFSGGIDSMSAASELIKNHNKIILVSHVTKGNKEVADSQINVLNSLKRFYQKSFQHIRFLVYGRKKEKYLFPKDRESTQRTRSFLFLTLAVIVMRRVNYNKVLYMGENGQFAIHLPLNQSRIGPFSTHTADPRYLHLMEELFQIMLGNPSLEIINPFQYKTKSEVFSLLSKELQQAAIDTISCWKYSRLKKHCGICIPCIARRIAIESNGLSFNEYHEDLFNSDISQLEDDNTGKRNLIDYLEFVLKLHNLVPASIQDFIYSDAPELLNDCIDQASAMNMYRKLAQESIDVFKKYPNICKLMV